MVSERMKEICKIGQGNDCCRYLACDDKGFCCLKSVPEMKKTVDAKVNRMNAQSDNCDGYIGQLE